jgi:hypothetical protein
MVATIFVLFSGNGKSGSLLALRVDMYCGQISRCNPHVKACLLEAG